MASGGEGLATAAGGMTADGMGRAASVMQALVEVVDAAYARSGVACGGQVKLRCGLARGPSGGSTRQKADRYCRRRRELDAPV